MRVAVIGAGIVGVTTAYELGADGHEVTVFERRGSVAAEGSFANAGLISPSQIAPWAGAGVRIKTFSQLLSRHAAVRVNPSLSPSQIAWMWRWWRACGASIAEANRSRLQRLTAFSRDRLHQLTRELKLDYERADGCLMLLRTPRELTRLAPRLASSNTRFETLDAAQCRALEPGLGAEAPLHGGIYLPDDEVGNCRQFAMLLRGEAQRLGVNFRFHTQVHRIIAGKAPELVHVYAPPDDATVLMNMSAESTPLDEQETQPMPMRPVAEAFDAVVVCAAVASARLLRPLGLKLPLRAVHGYSVTAPLRRADAYADHGPRATVVDERHQITISRLGTRVRVAGGAELGGSPTRHDPAALTTLYKALHDWFPGSARLSQAQVWKGARPMLPDGPPLLGPSGSAGVWLNVGHGANGWALACGSARIVSDQLAGRPAAIDLDGLGIERLGN